MIHSITLNPALDISGVVSRLVPNEKCYVRDELHTPGGNGINAGIIAHRLGASVNLTGFLGGPNGQEIKDLLNREKVLHRFISINGHTRMNITISNEDDHRQTRLSFPGPQIEAQAFRRLEAYLEKVKESDIVIFGGSMPSAFKIQKLFRLIEKLGKRGIKVIVDFPGPILKETIKSRPFFIKPNLTEFQELIQRNVTTVSQVLKQIKKLQDFVPVICVSSVEGGALLVTKDEAWFGKLPKVKIYSTVGAGDSMVGAMSTLWAKDKSPGAEDVLRMGLAASCATLTEAGMNLGKKKDIFHYRSKVLIHKL